MAHKNDDGTFSTYERQVKLQISQYCSGDDIHDLSPIFHYWVARHIGPRANIELGVSTPQDFYIGSIEAAINRTQCLDVVSIGSGDGREEIRIAEGLIARGIHPRIKCYELAPNLVDSGRVAIAKAGLGDIVEMIPGDLNNSSKFPTAAAVMANHSLHHIVDLEGIFGRAREALGEGGSFVTCDMIGRNGHLRWPESLCVLRSIWRRLPDRLKYHNQLKRFDPEFENVDCSTEGFEGIRAQDIVPTMLKDFYFIKLFSYGGLVDALVDRSYGPNFDAQDPLDRRIIDLMNCLEEDLICKDMITPTHMWAEARGRIGQAKAIIPHGIAPPVREPNQTFLNPDFDFVFKQWPFTLFPEQQSECGIELPAEATWVLGERDFRGCGLKWGWAVWEVSEPFVWATGEESAVEIHSSVVQRHVTIRLKTSGYVTESMQDQNVQVFVNGVAVGEIEHAWPARTVISDFPVRSETLDGKFEIVFRPSHYRRFDRDGGIDKRALSFTLSSVQILSQV